MHAAAAFVRVTAIVGKTSVARKCTVASFAGKSCVARECAVARKSGVTGQSGETSVACKTCLARKCGVTGQSGETAARCLLKIRIVQKDPCCFSTFYGFVNDTLYLFFGCCMIQFVLQF